MNRVIFVSVAVFLLVAPTFTLPVNEKSVEGSPEVPAKHPEENEVNGDVNRDVETIENHEIKSDENTDDTTSSVTGQSTGIITRIGIHGDFNCRNIVCPSGTQTCKYESKILRDGKNAEVNYKCTSSNGTVLLDQTKTEPAGETTRFDGFDISGFFKEMQEFMKNMFSNPFFGSDEIEQQ
ncbi:uncharacterized protein LOC116340950 [Contarinia nasturtii]|uniref:uncharacterized protein LOC116340950 n=1 Tax=Contarinia nasturtii TaxID=265458 RepID=UPI0012D42B85|nr:uncharacterized protein LOC116340950 [Contarinia nasturtii]